MESLVMCLFSIMYMFIFKFHGDARYKDCGFRGGGEKMQKTLIEQQLKKKDFYKCKSKKKKGLWI